MVEKSLLELILCKKWLEDNEKYQKERKIERMNSRHVIGAFLDSFSASFCWLVYGNFNRIHLKL